MRITSLGDYVLTPQVLELPYEVDNRGGAVRLGAPTAESAELALLPGGLPAPVPAGERGRFVVRLQAECRSLRQSQGRDAELRLPVTPASGRTRALPVPLDSDLLRGLADQACGVTPVTELVAVRALGPVRTTEQGFVFWLVARSTSVREGTIESVAAPGLEIASRDGLPAWLGPGQTSTLRVTMAVRSCALVTTGVGAQRVRPPELTVEVRDPAGPSSALPVELPPGADFHAAWLAYVDRACPNP